LEYRKDERGGLGGTMLNFERLILHNFGSYGHAELDLRNRGFCLVSGKNLYEKDNAVSNGSGKSFLWNAICFVFTGETLTGLHSNLKNINVLDDNNCYVELFFTESADSYHLTRIANPRSDLKVIKNDVDVSGKGVRESERKLSELLPDLTKNLITSTIIIGQGMPNKFSSFSPSGRKELLEKLTRADFMIEDIKQRVSERLTKLGSDIRVSEDSLLMNRSQLSVIESELKAKTAELEGLIQPNFELELIQLSQQYTELTELVKNHTTMIATIETEYQTATDSLLAVTEKKAKVAAEEQEAYTKAVLETQQKQLTIKADLDSITREITRLTSVKDTCPTCGQKIPGAIKPDTAVQEQQQLSLREQLTEISTKLSFQNTRHKEYQKAIAEQFDAELTTQKQFCETLRTKLANSKAQLTNATSQQADLQNRADKLKYESENWDRRKQLLQQKLVELESAVQKFKNTITLIEQDKLILEEHFKVVKKMETLIKRDFRGYLLSNIISYLNNKAKEYSEIVFGTKDLEVYLDGNDLNISYCGKMFDNLSGGEKQRVDLILQFTIRNMLTAYLNFNSNILVLDEITDFLDKKSCSAVLDLVARELNTIESVFIVSHHASELALPIDSEVVIRKNEAGISEIISGA
jgi:DNA repair exonuclease SbcCD ATPase subunit